MGPVKRLAKTEEEQRILVEEYVSRHVNRGTDPKKWERDFKESMWRGHFRETTPGPTRKPAVSQSVGAESAISHWNFS